MNGRERIINAIEGRPVDSTPVWPFVMAFAAKYAGVPYGAFAQDYQAMAKALIKTAEDFDFDAVTMDSDAYREASAFGALLDFPEDDLPIIVRHAIQDKASFPFTVPPIADSPRLIDKVEGIRACKSHFKDEKAVCGWVEAPLQSAGTLYDLNEFMIDLADESEFLHQLLATVTQLGIAFGLEQIHAGADIIGIGDAMASMVSAHTYEALILPYTQQLVNGLKGHGAKLKYHICGNATHVLPNAVKAGFDIVNIDCKVDAKAAFEAVGNALCIKGNLDPVGVLLSGSPQQVDAACRQLLGLHQPKFILSPGCEVPKMTPPANLHQMVRSAREYGASL